MRQKGLIEYLVDNKIDIKYTDIDEDTGISIMILTLMSDEEFNSMVKHIEEDDDKDILFLSKIIKKRLEFLDYQDRVSDHALLILTFLGLTTPGEAVIAAMIILDYLHEDENRKVTKDNIIIELFPDGVIDRETFTKVIDIVKEDKVKGDKREIRFSMLY